MPCKKLKHIPKRPKISCFRKRKEIQLTINIFHFFSNELKDDFQSVYKKDPNKQRKKISRIHSRYYLHKVIIYFRKQQLFLISKEFNSQFETKNIIKISFQITKKHTQYRFRLAYNPF